MDDSDPSPQLPLPAAVMDTAATVVRLPVAESPPARPLPRDLPRRRSSLWYALYFPQLASLDEPRQRSCLQALAGIVDSVSSTVSYQPLALVCEIRSSLKYFGGMNAIHERLSPRLEAQLRHWQLPGQFLYAASPTVSGSLLLARSGQKHIVYRRENLRSALGQLPADVLDLGKEHSRRLYNMGVRHIRDIWRLPADGLRKRFGNEFVNRLNRALGQAPEPTRNYVPPPAFTLHHELPYELDSLDRLLPVADEMLAQLRDFLRRRDLSTSQLEFALHHERRAATIIPIGLRQATRSRSRLLLLLETHFAQLQIPAPVIALKLDVKKFDAFLSHSESLLREGRPQEQGSQLDEFMEQLQARLGDGCVQRIARVAEHCPEYASANLDYQAQHRGRAEAFDSFTANRRPFWLLTEPRQLVVRNGRLYHRKPIHIISGPERIETRWWSGRDLRRDYYVAQEHNGSRLWIYRQRDGERHWFLHGLFA